MADWYISNGSVPYRENFPEPYESEKFDPHEKWLGSNIKWHEKTWPGSYKPTYGKNVWSDGSNIYYSGGSTQYVLDKSTSTWVRKTWSGSYAPVYGQFVWTDGERTYYSNSYVTTSTHTHSVLNKSTGEWLSKYWNTNLINGPDVWTDGTDIYCTCIQRSGQYIIGRAYVLDKSTGEWLSKDWGSPSPTYGRHIWTDGRDIYYSSGSTQYVLNRETSTWSSKTWTGLSSFNGMYVWSDGKEIYYSNDTEQYILNKSTSEWIPKEWPNNISFNGDDVWTDGDYIYCSNASGQYVLTSTIVPYRLDFPETNESESHIDYTTKWVITDDIPYRLDFPETNESEKFDTHDEWVADITGDKKIQSWEDKTWSGYSAKYGNGVWTDGTSVYYSNRSEQYVLNKSTNTWDKKIWGGLNYFYGTDVWSDGENIYYSYGSTQYVLDKSTSTWTTKTWDGYTSMSGSNIWSDGENIYYSSSSTQYVLDKSTSTWTTKTWRGLTSFDGKYIWSDGENIYYSYGTRQYVLNTSTSRWSAKGWNNYKPYSGYNVWSDGEDIYYSERSTQKVLDKSTSTWNEKIWDSMPSPGVYGYYIWRDGDNVYFSDSSQQCVLYSETKHITNTPYRLDFPSLKDSKDAKHDWYIDDDIPFQGGFPPLKESRSLRDFWLIDDDIPFKLDFPELLESIAPPKPIFWLQYAGYVPYRPWPGKIQIPNIADTVEIPEIDWTKSMQQTFEYFTVDPKTWYDDKQLFQIISSNHSIDLTSDLRGSATISTNELLGENYIRTYMVCKQGRYTHRVCLGTYLYMTSDDSFNGIVHTYTMTGYTPLVELQESMPPIGFFIYGQVKKGDEAPIITDEIKKAILENTRCELETNVTIPKPLLNNFVAGTDDNWLTVVNNLLSASNEARYMLTIDEWGTLQLKNSPIVSNMQPTFVYDDSNSSILLPEVNTGDDLFQIPNTVELIFVGNTRFRPCRKIVKNEDEASPVSVQNRGREIVKRYTISNIAIPASSNPTQEMIEEMIENQAYTLLETASTIQKTISYSHGYCGTKVGDCVMINYERAGLSNVKAVITSQKINCTPGCQVDETASYTKKYFKRN